MAVRWLAGRHGDHLDGPGWLASRTMIDSYAKATNEALAGAEFDRLDHGIDLEPNPIDSEPSVRPGLKEIRRHAHVMLPAALEITLSSCD